MFDPQFLEIAQNYKNQYKELVQNDDNAGIEKLLSSLASENLAILEVLLGVELD